MRQPIETAPRDGNFIILEDDANGSYDVACWSPEAGQWVGENDEPSKITPSHWHPMPGEKYNSLRVDERSSDRSRARASRVPAKRTRKRPGFTVSVAAILVTAAIVLYFRGEVTAFLTRYPGLQEILREEIRLARQELGNPDALVAQPPADQARAQTAAQDTAQVEQATKTSAPEARQPLQKEQRSDALPSELTEARRTIDAFQLQLKAEAERTVQSLKQEREKAVAQLQEVRAARQETTENAELHRRAPEGERAAALASELATARREIETQAALSRQAGDEAVQQRQVAEGTIAELKQSLQQEREKTTALMQEADAARQATTASAEQHRRALEEGQARTAALLSELAGARREIETQEALSRKANEAAQRGQAAESTIAELRQSLRQEREKTTALMQEADAARQATTASTQQHRRTLEEEQIRATALASELAGARLEIETQAKLARKADEEAAQRRQAAESTIAELRQSLQQERDRIQAMTRDAESARRMVGANVTVGRAADGQSVPATQITRTAPTQQSATAESHDNSEAARLIARAAALLGQGNIGAARIVLERIAETGNAQANFMLAETYDPAILSAWGTYGTRGEAAKAREFYLKAHAGGIQEAKVRFDALRQ